MMWVTVGSIGFLQWKNNIAFSMITAMQKIVSQRIFCSRHTKVKREFRKVEVNQSQVVRDYNKHVERVDRSGHRLSEITINMWKGWIDQATDCQKLQ